MRKKGRKKSVNAVVYRKEFYLAEIILANFERTRVVFACILKDGERFRPFNGFAENVTVHAKDGFIVDLNLDYLGGAIYKKCEKADIEPWLEGGS